MAERIREYECCALYRADVDSEVIDQQIEAIRSQISNRGGEVLRVDRWNKRFLAYPVKRHIEGIYVIYRWLGTPALLPDINYQLRYNENCLRYMVLDYSEKVQKQRRRAIRGKAKAEKV